VIRNGWEQVEAQSALVEADLIAQCG